MVFITLYAKIIKIAVSVDDYEKDKLTDWHRLKNRRHAGELLVITVNLDWPEESQLYSR